MARRSEICIRKRSASARSLFLFVRAGPVKRTRPDPFWPLFTLEIAIRIRGVRRQARRIAQRGDSHEKDGGNSCSQPGRSYRGMHDDDPYSGEPKVSKTGPVARSARASARSPALPRRRRPHATRLSAPVSARWPAALSATSWTVRKPICRPARIDRRQRHPGRQNIVLNMPSNITFASDQDGHPELLCDTRFGRAGAEQIQPDAGRRVRPHRFGRRRQPTTSRCRSAARYAVANYLTGRGVDSRRLVATGFGESRPIADNKTELGRAQNRRVEIQIVPLS